MNTIYWLKMKNLQPKLMMNVPVVFTAPFWYCYNNCIYPSDLRCVIADFSYF